MTAHHRDNQAGTRGTRSASSNGAPFRGVEPLPVNPGQHAGGDWESACIARLRAAAGDASYRAIAARTGANWETVRRYMTRGRAPGRFLAAFAEAYGVSGDWLLAGRGVMAAAPTGVAPLAGPPAQGHAVAVLEITGSGVRLISSSLESPAIRGESLPARSTGNAA